MKKFKTILDGDGKFMFNVEVPKRAVFEKNFSGIFKAIKINRQITDKTIFGTSIDKNMPPDSKIHACMHLSIDGYNFDSRELAEIPEVKAYYSELLRTCPQILFFLDDQSIFVALVCTLASKNSVSEIEGKRIPQSEVKPVDFLKFITDGYNSVIAWLQDDSDKKTFTQRWEGFIEVLFSRVEVIK